MSQFPFLNNNNNIQQFNNILTPILELLEPSKIWIEFKTR